MKKFVTTFLFALLAVFMVPTVAEAATDKVTYTVVADKSTANPGDTVQFTVSMGAVENLGGMDIGLSVPEGLTIVDESITIADGVLTKLDAIANMFVSPTKANGYFWSHFAGATGYTGTEDITLMTFRCTVDEDSAFESKSVSLVIDSCFDNVDVEDFETEVVPVNVTIEKAKVAVSGVSLDKNAVTLKDGDTVALTATVAPADADNQKVSWSTSDKAVATVADGTVTAVKEGSAVITVTTEDGNKTATCTVTVTCNHDLDKTAAVGATCGKDGNIEYYTCSKCNKKYADENGTTEVTDVVVAATGKHGETEVKDAVAATEEKEGYSGDTYCKVCGNKIKDGTVLQKLPHTHAMNKTEAVKATCEKDGNIEYYTCSKCSKTYSDEAGTKEVTSVVDKATGHKPGATWEQDSTNHWKVCTVCSKEVEKAAHDYKWVVDKAATEDAIGLKHEECICGVKRNENTEIPKLDHVHTGIQHYAAVEATCMKEGAQEYWTCSSAKCAGKYYSDKDCQIEVTDIVVAKNPENHVEEGTWDMDIEKHTRICACGVKVSEGNHEYQNEEDANCDICEYKRFYVVVEGANTAYEQGGDGDLTFRIDGEFSLFESLEINGSVVDKAYYTIAEGSTIITLKNSYLEKLEVGEYKLVAKYSDGKVSTTNFTIEEEDDDEDDEVVNTTDSSANQQSTLTSPKTGDDSNILVWLMVLALVGIAGAIVVVGKRAHNR